jgi:hypothetical protein
LFGLGLYEIRSCVSRIKPVHDVMDVYLPLAWFNGGQDDWELRLCHSHVFGRVGF